MSWFSMPKLQKKVGAGKAILKKLDTEIPIAVLLAKEEGFDVELKRSTSGLENEDLVAFANSSHGGTILIGVEEKKDEKGRQIPIVVGCPVGDQEKQKIIGKAQGCTPTLTLTVSEEQIDGKTIYRVSIPSGPDKPYCTSGGTYKIRGDGRNLPLQPQDLLNIFLDSHGRQFLQRFQDATSDLRQTMERTTQTMSMAVENAVEKISNDVQFLDTSMSKVEEKMSEAIEQISVVNTTTEKAVDLSEQASGLVEEVQKKIEEIEQDRTLEVIREMIDALLNHAGLEDPVFVRDRNAVKATAAYLLQKDDKDYAKNPRSLVDAIKHIRNPYYTGHLWAWIQEVLAAPITLEEAAQLDPNHIGLLVRSLEEIRKELETAKAMPKRNQPASPSSKVVRRKVTKKGHGDRR
jgi:ATP-dependent DNA helicase RecG